MRRSKKTIKIESVRGMEKIEKMESKTFNIDRKKEDKNVVRYQKTGDVEILEKLYEGRISSLQFWTSHYYYLMDNSKEDMFAELRNQFMKAVVYYDQRRGHFNTCLYTFIRNCIRNLLVGKHAKKRRPEGIGFDFTNGFIISLDKPLEGKDGASGTLMDVVSDQLKDGTRAPDKMSLGETIEILSRDDDRIRGYLKKISDGVTLANLVKECKTVTGSIRVNKKQSKYLRTRKDIVKLIKTEDNIEDSFKLLDYQVCEPLRINYKIEMHKSKEADFFLKIIRRLRKNRERYMEAIRS